MIKLYRMDLIAGCMALLVGIFFNHMAEAAVTPVKNVIQGDGQVLSMELYCKADFNRRSVTVTPDMKDDIVSETIYSAELDNVRIVINNGIYTESFMKEFPDAKRSELIQKSMINQLTTINKSKEYTDFNIVSNEEKTVNGLVGREAVMTYIYNGVKIKTKVFYILHKNEIWAVCFDMVDGDSGMDAMTDHAFETLQLKEYV